MEDELCIDVVTVGDVSSLNLAGEFTAVEGSLVFEAVDTVLAGGSKCVQLRMTGVSFMDSSGISELLRLRDLVEATGGVLRIARPSQTVMKLLAITNLTSILEIVGETTPAGD